MIATLFFATLAIPNVHLNVSGEGYLQLETPSGFAYAKSGEFKTSNGILTHESGFPLVPKVIVPSGTTSLEVTSEGVLVAVIAGSKTTLKQITLAKFSKDAQPTPAKGVFLFFEAPILCKPGTAGAGTIHTGLQSTAPFNGLTQIVVNERTEVPKSRFSIGEIAEVNAPPQLREKIQNAIVGNSPALDIPRVITTATIQAALRMANLPLEAIDIRVPPKAYVVRASQVLSADEVSQQLVAWMTAQRPDLVGKKIITPLIDRKIPQGEVDCRFRVTGENDRGATLLLEAFVDEERLFGIQISVSKSATSSSISSATPTIKVGQPVQVILNAGSITVEATGKISWVGTDGRVKVIVDPNRVEMIGTVRPDGVVEVTL